MSIPKPSLQFPANQSRNEEEVYLEEWRNSSNLLFHLIFIVSIVTLLLLVSLLIHLRTVRRSHFSSYLTSIVIANCALLSTILASVIIETTGVFYEVGFIECKLSTFIVNSSSCFIHWTWVTMYAERFIYIFFPFHLRRPYPRRTNIILVLLVLISLLSQIWTFFIISEKSIIAHFDGIYCGEDPKLEKYSQLILVVECIVTFFIPLILTISADISVLIWKIPRDRLMSMASRDNLRHNSVTEGRKIVSKLSIEHTKRVRSLAIRRCLISATITLMLNLPNYSLQLLDEFFQFRESPSIIHRRIFLRVDAFFYILYLMQFPLTPLHIFLLSRVSKKRSPSSV